MSLKKDMLAGLRAWVLSDKGVGKEVSPLSAKEVAYSVDWVRSVPFIALHLMCLGIFIVGWSPVAIAVCVGMYFVRMFFITGFYHRYFSHRTFKANRFMQLLLALAGTSCTQKGPLWWAAHHRQHHKHSDDPEDPHSPDQHGIFWSHIGWITDKRNFPTRMSLVPDLARFRELRFLDQFDLLVPASMGVGMYFLGEFLSSNYPSLGTNGWQMLIWGFFVSTIFLLHGSCMINSAAHLMGKQNYKTGDQSRNSLILSLFTLGEGWHNNHHYYPATARQGFLWWELDITFYILKVMSWLKLIRDLRPVPKQVLSARLSRSQIPG